MKINVFYTYIYVDNISVQKYQIKMKSRGEGMFKFHGSLNFSRK